MSVSANASNSQARPPNMPPYPLTKFQLLKLRKRTLLSDMMWMEIGLTGGDFSHYIPLIKSKKELKEINEALYPEK